MSGVRLPLAQGLCADCWHETAPKVHPGTGKIVGYCPHNRSMAWLGTAPDGSLRWSIITPVSESEYLERLRLYDELLAATQNAPGAAKQ